MRRTSLSCGWLAVTAIVTATAVANGGAPILEKRPFMGLSDGERRVSLIVDLDRSATARSVRIDGSNAVARRTGFRRDGVFTAVVARGRMRAGGTYKVNLVFCTGVSACMRREMRLVLHQRFRAR